MHQATTWLSLTGAVLCNPEPSVLSLIGAVLCNPEPSVLSLFERFKTLMALNIKITLYWDVTPCSLEDGSAASICKWKKHVTLIGHYVGTKLHGVIYLKVLFITDLFNRYLTELIYIRP
jgi:hypothetical protein